MSKIYALLSNLSFMFYWTKFGNFWHITRLPTTVPLTVSTLKNSPDFWWSMYNELIKLCRDIKTDPEGCAGSGHSRVWLILPARHKVWPCVCMSGIVSNRLNGSSWFGGTEASFALAYTALANRVSPKIRGGLRNFRHGRRSSQSVINLVRQRWTLGSGFTKLC